MIRLLSITVLVLLAPARGEAAPPPRRRPSQAPRVRSTSRRTRRPGGLRGAGQHEDGGVLSRPGTRSATSTVHLEALGLQRSAPHGSRPERPRALAWWSRRRVDVTGPARAAASPGARAPGFDAMVEVARHAATIRQRPARGARRVGRDGTAEPRRDSRRRRGARFGRRESCSTCSPASGPRTSAFTKVAGKAARSATGSSSQPWPARRRVRGRGQAAGSRASKAASSRDPILQYYALNAMAQRGGTANAARAAGRRRPDRSPRGAARGDARAQGRPFALARSKDAIARQAAAFALKDEPGERGRDALHGLIEDEDGVAPPRSDRSPLVVSLPPSTR